MTWERIWERLRSGAVEAGVLLVKAGRAWSRDNGSRMAASLAFYAAFSIAPLIMLVMGVAGLMFDEQMVEAELTAHLHEFVGPRIEEFVWEVVQRWQDRGAGLRASIVALLALGWSAFRGFDALRATLNMVWRVEKRTGASVFDRLLRRAGTFVMMLCVGALTIASLIFSTIVAEVVTQLDTIPWFSVPALARIETVGSMLLVAALFAMIFKWAPNVELSWRDAIVGAVFTAVVFALGKYLVELVLTYVSSATVFGAAAAMVTLLLWVYLAAMIFFFGAEFTKFWARRHGDGIRPDSTAVRVERLPTVRDAIVEALGEEAARKVDQQLGVSQR